MSAKLIEFNFRLYKTGDEIGFAYLYNAYYKTYYWQSMRMVKNNVVADSIAQEVFLKLWLMRETIVDVNSVNSFLQDQTKNHSRSYYKKSSTRFHKNLLMLDDYPNYQDFMLGCEFSFDGEETLDDIYLEDLEKEQQEQLNKVLAVLPNLKQEQQLFIRLCLRYAFSYDRISYHLGGISDYEVARMVEKSILALKSVLLSSKKLEANISPKKRIIYEGNLNEEQLEILNLRYEMQYSFEEIATALNLSQQHVQQQFVNAYASIKKPKPNSKRIINKFTKREIKDYSFELKKAM
jgi:RNA polymerase sigma factor (sigma-70 family)